MPVVAPPQIFRNIGSQTRKNKLNKLRKVQLKKNSAKFVKFSAKLRSLNVQIINTLKNIILIACKWSKICQYYVIIMVISRNTCQKEEK